MIPFGNFNFSNRSKPTVDFLDEKIAESSAFTGVPYSPAERKGLLKGFLSNGITPYERQEKFEEDYEEVWGPVIDQLKEEGKLVENDDGPAKYGIADSNNQDGILPDSFYEHPAVKWVSRNKGKAAVLGLSVAFLGGYGVANVLQDDHPADRDVDGVSNCYEKMVLNTDPDNPDTDGDTIQDGLEVVKGSDPLKPNPKLAKNLRNDVIYNMSGEGQIEVVMSDGTITRGYYMPGEDQYYSMEGTEAEGPMPAGSLESYQDFWSDLSEEYGPFNFSEPSFPLIEEEDSGTSKPIENIIPNEEDFIYTNNIDSVNVQVKPWLESNGSIGGVPTYWSDSEGAYAVGEAAVQEYLEDNPQENLGLFN